MTWWPEFIFYFGFVLLNTVVPFLLCWFALMAFSKVGGPQIGMWRTLLLTLIGCVAFCLVGIAYVIVFSEIYANQEPFLLMLFLAVYSVVTTFPIKYISKFRYFKAALLVIVFWMLQIAIQEVIHRVIFKPL